MSEGKGGSEGGTRLMGGGWHGEGRGRETERGSWLIVRGRCRRQWTSRKWSEWGGGLGGEGEKGGGGNGERGEGRGGVP